MAPHRNTRSCGVFGEVNVESRFPRQSCSSPEGILSPGDLGVSQCLLQVVIERRVSRRALSDLIPSDGEPPGLVRILHRADVIRHCYSG